MRDLSIVKICSRRIMDGSSNYRNFHEHHPFGHHFGDMQFANVARALKSQAAICKKQPPQTDTTTAVVQEIKRNCQFFSGRLISRLAPL